MTTTIVEKKSNDLDYSDCKSQIYDRRFCYDCCGVAVRHIISTFAEFSFQRSHWNQALQGSREALALHFFGNSDEKIKN